MEASLKNIPAWIEADLDFHEAVAELSGNRLLHLQLRGLRPVIREVMELFNARRQRSTAEWRETYQRHVAVLAAVRSGNATTAFDAMTHHFDAAEGAIQEIFPRED
jgi:GntR family transcriptional repressor for pyruvate dehydrogenase complex